MLPREDALPRTKGGARTAGVSMASVSHVSHVLKGSDSVSTALVCNDDPPAPQGP